MDRRQQKTRTAIFGAFSQLLGEKNYSKITVQEIIDAADVGRTTFYAHFETKDDLLKALCEELFGHIVDSAIRCDSHEGLHSKDRVTKSVFCHLLHHLQENDNNILGLLSCESRDLFLRYFKDSLNELIRGQVVNKHRKTDIPQDFLVNHISGSFVEMVLWWIQGRMKQTPEELDGYFQSVMVSVL